MSEQVIELQTSSNKWCFSLLGGRLLSWDSFDPKAQLWRRICDSDQQKLPTDDAYRGSIVFPWCNRLGGEFYDLPRKDGTSKHIPVDKTFAEGYLHGGQIANQQWSLLSVTEGKEVCLQIIVKPNEFFPFHLRCTARYQVVMLGDSEQSDQTQTDLSQIEIPSMFRVATTPRLPITEGLALVIEVENLDSEEEAWVGVGFHPYFKNPFADSINQMTMSLRVSREIEVDEETLIPYHPLEFIDPVPVEHDFDGLSNRLIATTQFDNCFELDPELLQTPGVTVATLQINNFLLEVVPETTESKTKNRSDKPAIRFLQVYTPPSRDSVAFEPQTAVTNHFQYPYDELYGNSVLQPGETLSYSCMFIVTWSFD